MQFNIPAEHRNASGVYIIRNSVNAKVYVGSAVNFRQRFNRHKSRLGLGLHHSAKLQNFVNKHGSDKLSFSLLGFCDSDKATLLIHEQKWLDLLRPDKTGFNICIVSSSRLGVKGKPLSPAQKESITLAHKGKVVSPETRQRIREANTGKTATDETKAKLRKARAHRICSQATREKMSATRTGKSLNLSEEQREALVARHKGKRRSEEARQKMSAARTGRKQSEETKQKRSEAMKKYHLTRAAAVAQVHLF